ncbi:alpha/beta hydrolase [Rhodococcus sp. NPDC058521]|uniref:alpha/beta hydrolase n=1 Tax=Rhodococcus sp. NPDC058521 TaxID=3346536 RepID=UPI00365A4EBF
MIHGGGWLEDHDLSYFQPLSASLAEEGVAVWNVEYRRVDGAGGWPVTLADVDDATETLATVVQEKADNRLDLDRVHLAGHSAGGHLPIGLPVTALHGDNDQTVSIDQSRNYTAAAVAVGDPAQLQVLPGTGHGDFGNPDSAAWATAREAILGHVGTVD